MSNNIITFMASNPIAKKKVFIEFEDVRPGKNITVPLNLELLWSLYESAHLLRGVERLLMVANVSTSIWAAAAQYQGDRNAPKDKMYSVIWQITQSFPKLDEDASLEECILAFTHTLVNQKKITYPDAAAFASAILNTSMNADAWRLRVKRWAKRHGVPPPATKRGRPSLKKPTEKA